MAKPDCRVSRGTHTRVKHFLGRIHVAGLKHEVKKFDISKISNSIVGGLVMAVLEKLARNRTTSGSKNSNAMLWRFRHQGRVQRAP